jgi:hypothetical protein
LKTLSILVLIFLFARCTPHENSLTKVWIYNDNQSSQQQIDNRLRYKGHESYLLTSANFINLQPDSTFTATLPSFKSGKWFFRENSLILVDQNRKITELQVDSLGDEELICSNKMEDIVYRFNGFKNSFPSASESPFSPENNQWRQKAAHKESDAEIAARLQNHFKYWEKFFAWGKNNDIGSIDYTATPSPLKMYGNGFGIQYPDNQLPEWKNSFRNG